MDCQSLNHQVVSNCGLYILGSFCDNKNFKPFVIGCYVGKTHPNSSELFLKDFVEEAKDLIDNGVFLGMNERKINFKIRVFTSDAPARSLITEVMSHASLYGCSKCNQVGVKLPSTSVVYSKTAKTLRTDDSFKNRTDTNHHHRKYRNN